jgi:hypothetical protein
LHGEELCAARDDASARDCKIRAAPVFAGAAGSSASIRNDVFRIVRRVLACARKAACPAGFAAWSAKNAS